MPDTVETCASVMEQVCPASERLPEHSPQWCGPVLLQSITISGIPGSSPSLSPMGPGNSIRGEMEEGAGFPFQEHSIPAAQTRGDPSQGQKLKGTSVHPRSPHSFQVHTITIQPQLHTITSTFSP